MVFLCGCGGSLTTGSIDIASNPPGANVYLDGEDTGFITPIILDNVTSGSHTIKLVLALYEEKVETVSITAGKTTHQNWPLTHVSSNTTTLQPRPTEGKDVYVHSIKPTNQGNSMLLYVGRYVTGTGTYRTYLQFDLCKNLKDITMPNGLVSIGEDAFTSCVGLTSLHIPNSVTTIGRSAFSNCENIKSFTIPDSVTEIADWTFGSCSSLTEIIIPQSISKIGDYAFSFCAGLKRIAISDSVTQIGGNAFNFCENLKIISIGANVSIGGSIFRANNFPEFKKVYEAAGRVKGTYILIGGVWQIQ